MNNKKLLFIIILFMLLIIIKYKLSKKENLIGNMCSANCGNIKIKTKDDEEICLNCSYCGICTTKNGDKNCVNGTYKSPLFIEDCTKWEFKSSGKTDTENVGRKYFGYQDNIISNDIDNDISSRRINDILNENNLDYNQILDNMNHTLEYSDLRTTITTIPTNPATTTRPITTNPATTRPITTRPIITTNPATTRPTTNSATTRRTTTESTNVRSRGSFLSRYFCSRSLCSYLPPRKANENSKRSP